MPDINVWLGSVIPATFQADPVSLAYDTARRIDERPSWIVLNRKALGIGNNTTIQLPVQKVRLEAVQSIRNASEKQNTQLDISEQYVIGLGLKNHPTLSNLDIQRADTFFYQGRTYEVIEFFDNIPGRLLFSCELTP